MYLYSFEKLDVWQESRKFTKFLYMFTSDFPAHERYGLISQLRRASISLCSNIAEGCSRTSQKDQAHFYQIAYGSLMEVLNQCIISHDLGYISDVILKDSRVHLEKISRMLNSLRKSLDV